MQPKKYLIAQIFLLLNPKNLSLLNITLIIMNMNSNYACQLVLVVIMSYPVLLAKDKTDNYLIALVILGIMIMGEKILIANNPQRIRMKDYLIL